MAEYRISGIWKTNNGNITHYAFHTVNGSNSITRAHKTSKADAIAIVSNPENNVMTWMWSYANSFWVVGEKVHVVHSINGSYLRSNHDKKVIDNLSHLIDFDWLKQ